MDTAQTITIPNSDSLATAFGITSNELFVAAIIVALMVIGFWAIVKYNSSDRVANPRLIGSKGGKVKKTIIEYSGDPDDI